MSSQARRDLDLKSTQTLPSSCSSKFYRLFLIDQNHAKLSVANSKLAVYNTIAFVIYMAFISLETSHAIPPKTIHKTCDRNASPFFVFNLIAVVFIYIYQSKTPTDQSITKTCMFYLINDQHEASKQTHLHHFLFSSFCTSVHAFSRQSSRSWYAE